MKKNFLLLCLAMLVLKITNAQSVSINTDGSAPDPSAILDIKSDTKGLLIPRMSSVNRLAIAGVEGLMVYDTDTHSFWNYTGSTWAQSTSSLWGAFGTSIYNTNTGNIFLGSVLISPFLVNNRVTIGQPDDPTSPGFTGNDFVIYNPDGIEGMSLYQSPSATYWYTNTNFALMANGGSGNVGIGTASPSTKLEVSTGSGNWGIIHTNGTVRVGTYVGSGGGWVATQSNSPLYFATSLLNTNGSAQMTLLQNGNFGIGGINPVDKLEVTTADGSYGIIHSNGTVKIGTYVGSNGGWLGTKTNHPLYFFTNNSNALMTISTTGNVGIGTISPAYKLSVNGTIQTKEVRVETGWADFVFDKNYPLLPVNEVEKYITKHNHLPGIPAAVEIKKKGLAVGDMQTKMMQKIEELTLYIIDLQKQINELKK